MSAGAWAPITRDDFRQLALSVDALGSPEFCHPITPAEAKVARERGHPIPDPIPSGPFQCGPLWLIVTQPMTLSSNGKVIRAGVDHYGKLMRIEQ